MKTTEEYGFRPVSDATWLNQDMVLAAFARMLPSGEIVPMGHDGWLRLILQPQLGEHVPIEIRKLYEVARGSAVYGFFFYPVFTLAAEQLTRVAEAVVYHRSQPFLDSSQRYSFGKRITTLRRQKILGSDAAYWWNTVRDLRNLASHPTDQSILMPGDFMHLLEALTENTNRLFLV